MSALVVPFGAIWVVFVIVAPALVFHGLKLKVSLDCNKFHGQTSTNPALLMRVPLDARVNDKSPLPSLGTTE
jgi:hypothetical protein